MCVDYRSLNKLIVRDKHPIPVINDCLDRLDGRELFSVIYIHFSLLFARG